MKTIRRTFSAICTSALLLTLVVSTAAQQVAVKGETVHTSAGEPITNGVVLISDGVIEQVGPESDVQIPSGYEVHEAAVVTPGFIDAHSVVGLAGIYNVDADQDQLEKSSAIQPDLRAIDAYNAREELVGVLRDRGITTVHTGHGPGAVISGQTMIAKTTGTTVDEALVDSTTALAMTVGSVIRNNFDTPATRSKAIAMLRQELIDAREYMEAEEDQPRVLKKEALARMLKGEIYALITAHTARDILTALRLQREFGFELLLDGAAEAYLVMDEIKEAGVPVIIHPTMMRLGGDGENASFETAGKLADAGITVLFQSGYEGYVPKTRVAHFEAAIAVANGMGYDQAMNALTIDAARILGIDDRVGSIEVGKEADLALFNGDPFEYTTTADGVFINGQLVSRGELK
ncbi:MAG: amidohydrolase family protein [Bacteroidetes bacterium]|jgi:imidazolonepropionase-like amidohydrolase|nr:amidohydrolase family protein [Bacteroidota bacterium]